MNTAPVAQPPPIMPTPPPSGNELPNAGNTTATANPIPMDANGQYASVFTNGNEDREKFKADTVYLNSTVPW